MFMNNSSSQRLPNFVCLKCHDNNKNNNNNFYRNKILGGLNSKVDQIRIVNLFQETGKKIFHHSDIYTEDLVKI